MLHSLLRTALRSLLLTSLLALGGAGSVLAQDIDAQAHAIAARLRCPVCQNESVADSPAELAAQMRALIRQKLQAGESPEQIIAYFVSKYGDWILLEPPRKGILWLVWVGPLSALLAGLTVAGAFLRRAVRHTHQPGGVEKASP